MLVAVVLGVRRLAVRSLGPRQSSSLRTRAFGRIMNACWRCVHSGFTCRRSTHAHALRVDQSDG